MAAATPTRICAVLATPQDVQHVRVDDSQLFAATGAQLSVNRTRVAEADSSGSLALAIPGGDELVSITRDPVTIAGGRRYYVHAQVQLSDVHPVRLGVSLFDGHGALRTTRWSAALPQPAGQWVSLGRPIDPSEQVFVARPTLEIATGGAAGGAWLGALTFSRIAHTFPSGPEAAQRTLVRQLTASAIDADATLTLSLVERGAVPQLRHRLLSRVPVAAGEPLSVDLNQVAHPGDYLVVSSEHGPVACSVSGVSIT